MTGSMSPGAILDRITAQARDMGFDAVEWALRYFLLGAVVVFPIWLIARIIKMAGKGGSAGSQHSSSPQAEQ